MKDKINPDNNDFDASEEYFKMQDESFDQENEEYFPLEDSKPPHY